MYLHGDLIRSAFGRLREIDPKEKRGMERTSCLMYFLAFDEVAANRGEEAILLDPKSAAGLANRQEYAARYSRLVHIGFGLEGEDWFVTNLGSVNTEARRTPDKKLSADFLTVPLKRASQSADPQPHPKRPNPLLLLGIEIHKEKWGAQRHPDWQTHCIAFLSDRVSSTPWSDLAIFVFRDTEFEASDLQTALKQMIEERFSEDLAAFWKLRIDSESKKRSFPDEWNQENVSHVLRQLAAEDGKDEMADDRASQTIAEYERKIKELAEENAELKKRLKEMSL